MDSSSDLFLLSQPHIRLRGFSQFQQFTTRSTHIPVGLDYKLIKQDIILGHLFALGFSQGSGAPEHNPQAMSYSIS